MFDPRLNFFCGSNAFKGYFDDAKEFKNQEKDSREVSSFKFSRIKNNQEQDSRLKIQESRFKNQEKT